MKAAKEQLRDIKVSRTFVGGKQVYSKWLRSFDLRWLAYCIT
jgi:hypothetical protein